MEKVVWKGTFAEAEERDNEYWSGQTEVERLGAMLRMNNIYYGVLDEPMKKVMFIRKLGDEEE